MGHTNRKPWSWNVGNPMPLAPSQIPPEMVGILTVGKGRFMSLCHLIITLITIRSKIISRKSSMDISHTFSTIQGYHSGFQLGSRNEDDTTTN